MTAAFSPHGGFLRFHSKDLSLLQRVVDPLGVAGLFWLLLGTGHCFRDHVLEVCPEFARYASQTDGIRKTFEGSSLETIKHMVAAGMGVTLVPRLSVPKDALVATAKRKKTLDTYVRYLPIVEGKDAPPTRRVVLAWRRSFTRYEAIAALRNAIVASELPGVMRLS